MLRQIRFLVLFSLFITPCVDVRAQTSISSGLDKVQLGDIDIETCIEDGRKTHSLSVDFNLPVSMNKSEHVKTEFGWRIFAHMQASGNVHGAISGSASGTLDNWKLGLKGAARALIDVSIPITGTKRTLIGRRWGRTRTRSFGYIGARFLVDLSDKVSIENQCTEAGHRPPGVITGQPNVSVTVLQYWGTYTGPLKLILRKRIESRMKAQFFAQINRQVASSTSMYQAKREEVVRGLIGKLPRGCGCFVEQIVGAIGIGGDPAESSDESSEKRYTSGVPQRR